MSGYHCALSGKEPHPILSELLGNTLQDLYLYNSKPCKVNALLEMGVQDKIEKENHASSFSVDHSETQLSNTQEFPVALAL